jgi:hypothetical protein
VRHLIEKGHLKDAATFVPRCDSNKRVDLYVDCGDWRAAGKECKERGDKAKMECGLAPLLRQSSLTKFVSQATTEELPQLLDRKGAGSACSWHEMTRASSIDSDTTRSVTRLLICLANVQYYEVTFSKCL